MSTTTDLSALEPMIDIALVTGMVVVAGDIAVVPDIWLLEEEANGHAHHLPATWTAVRSDGRKAWVYWWPEVEEDE